MVDIPVTFSIVKPTANSTCCTKMQVVSAAMPSNQYVELWTRWTGFAHVLPRSFEHVLLNKEMFKLCGFVGGLRKGEDMKIGRSRTKLEILHKEAINSSVPTASTLAFPI